MNLLISFAVILIGILIFCTPEWYNEYRGIHYDFSSFRVLASTSFVIMGLVGVITSFRSMNRTSNNDTMMICPDCEQTIIAYKAPDGRCPQCGGELEPLYGFYERHPELQDKPEKTAP